MKGRLAVAILTLVILVASAYMLIGQSKSGPGSNSTVYEADFEAGKRADVLVDDTGAAKAVEADDDDLMRIVNEGLPIPGCESIPPEPGSKVAFRFENDAHAIAERLAATENSELVLASALLTKDKDERNRRFERAYELDANSRIALWHLVHSCVNIQCTDTGLLDRAASLDGDNAAIWAQRARVAIARDDWVAAEQELRQATAATRYDVYFVEQIQLLENALAASGDMDYPERMIAAIGLVAAIAIPGNSEIRDACRRDDVGDDSWIDICDAFGEVMQQSSRTILDHAMGIAIRQAAVERKGDTELLADLSERRDGVQELINEMVFSGGSTALENDISFLTRYVDHFATFGEVAAMQFSIDDAKRLRADPTYDQCNFVRRKAIEE